MNTGFYSELRVIDSFSKVIDPGFYLDAPADWWVMITDVKGSTKAIEEGRYKDVNQLGVATITLVKNMLDNEDFLFVFGGDGATLVLSDWQYNKVQPAFSLLQQIAGRRFQLELRVGAVQVREVLQYQCRLQVALLKINDNQNLPVFQGGGLTKAEEIVKSRDYPNDSHSENVDPSLQGLSCRWQPLPARNGKVASILIACRDNNSSSRVFPDVIAGLNKIFDGDIDSANPVNIFQTEYKGIMELVGDEARLHRSVFTTGFSKRLLEIIISVLGFKFGLPLFQTKNYISAIPGHSDYKKFDDIIRMVLDGTVEQIHEMTDYLEKLYQQEKIFYGVHESPQALMTCLVEGLADGEHIHFIDGGDGGYAMAAKSMKAQMNA